MISKDEVKHIASLARIGISDEEVKKFQKDLGAILDYVKELEGVDTKDIEPANHVTGAENVMREDEAPREASQDKKQKLIEAAPHKKDGYVKTKAILS